MDHHEFPAFAKKILVLQMSVLIGCKMLNNLNLS